MAKTLSENQVSSSLHWQVFANRNTSESSGTHYVDIVIERTKGGDTETSHRFKLDPKDPVTDITALMDALQEHQEWLAKEPTF